MKTVADKNRIWQELDTEFKSFYEAEYRKLSDYFQPRRGRYLMGEAEYTSAVQRSNVLIDATPRRSCNYLAAGLMAGVTSPARPWFKLSIDDKETADFYSVKWWLEDSTRKLRAKIANSNIYQVIQSVYTESSAFGTGALGIMEQWDGKIYAMPLTVGQYRIAQDALGKVNLLMYQVRMSASQMVQAFGDNVSRAVKDAYQSGKTDRLFKVKVMCEENRDYKPNNPFTKKYSYCAWEDAGSDKFLVNGGFEEFPFMVHRWDVNSDEVYGTDCPGMRSIGVAKALQAMHKDKAKAVKKSIDPTIVLPSSVKNQGFQDVPNAKLYLDPMGMDAKQAYPLHSSRPDIQGMLLEIEDARRAIKEEFFVDLFLMLAQSDRRQMTATEVAERHEEKLLMLGPVLERFHYELLSPMITRVFNIMMRNGEFEDLPLELQGDENIKIEYTSILSQAQRAIGVNVVERYTAFAGSLMQLFPDVGDKVDADELLSEYGESLGITPKAERPDADVERIRQQRAAAMQQQAQVEQASQMGNVAAALGAIPSEGSVLNDLGLS